MTDDLQWTITGSTYLSKTYTSKKQFLDEVINPLNDRLSKRIVPKVNALYADGDVVVAIWDGTATATDGKPYNTSYSWNMQMRDGTATATDGKPYNTSYSWNMQMRDGKIIKVIAFLDGIEFQDIMTRLQPSKQ